VSVALPEFRADQVLVTSDDRGAARFGVHFEYQTRPDRSVLLEWCLKSVALNRQLRFPVFLVALFLQRGDRATFPSSYMLREGPLLFRFRFNAVRLWEHTELLRSGELPELAPLLFLCEDSPGEEVIRKERELIRSASVEPTLRSDLIAVTYAIGTRWFLRGVLNALFKEEMPLLKDAGIISDWLEEARTQAIAEGLAAGMAEGLIEGRVEGRVEGRLEGLAEGRAIEARRLTLRLPRNRFGELPAEVVQQIVQSAPEACEALVDRAARAKSLSELFLS